MKTTLVFVTPKMVEALNKVVMNEKSVQMSTHKIAEGTWQVELTYEHEQKLFFLGMDFGVAFLGLDIPNEPKP